MKNKKGRKIMSDLVYSTKDAEEASFLWTLDDKFVLKDITTSEGVSKNVVWFHFSVKVEPDEADRIREDYNSGLAVVEPKKYAYRRNEVRKIIHEKQLR